MFIWIYSQFSKMLFNYRQKKSFLVKSKKSIHFHKQDVTIYLTYIKILKDLKILNFRLHIPEAIFKVL